MSGGGKEDKEKGRQAVSRREGRQASFARKRMRMQRDGSGGTRNAMCDQLCICVCLTTLRQKVGRKEREGGMLGGPTSTK